MVYILMAAGIVLLLLGITAYRKFPGIKLKYVRICLLAGIIVFIIGVILFFKLPKKGLLSEGSENSTENTETAGGLGSSGETEADPGTIIVYGNDILIGGRSVGNVAGLDDYIASSGFKGGYILVDRYAVYDTYNEVKEFLRTRGKEILKEEQAE